MKKEVCYLIGIIGGCISFVTEKCNVPLQTLLLFMSIDYVSGIMIALIFKKSPKTESGALKSEVGWKGLCKKGMMLIYVLIGTRLDLLIHNDYIADAICIGFIVNELISIIENAGIMGIPMPGVLKKAIDILKTEDDS